MPVADAESFLLITAFLFYWKAHLLAACVDKGPEKFFESLSNDGGLSKFLSKVDPLVIGVMTKPHSLSFATARLSSLAGSTNRHMLQNWKSCSLKSTIYTRRQYVARSEKQKKRKLQRLLLHLLQEISPRRSPILVIRSARFLIRIWFLRIRWSDGFICELIGTRSSPRCFMRWWNPPPRKRSRIKHL